MSEYLSQKVLMIAYRYINNLWIVLMSINYIYLITFFSNKHLSYDKLKVYSNILVYQTLLLLSIHISLDYILGHSFLRYDLLWIKYILYYLIISNS